MNTTEMIERVTGLQEIPRGTPDDIVSGHILARKGDLYIVGVGNPTEEEDGTYTYHEFRIVDMREGWRADG